MDKKTILRCVVLQIIIIVFSIIAWFQYSMRWGIVFFAVCEITSVLVIGIAAFLNYRSSRVSVPKKTEKQVGTSLTASELRDWVQFSNSLDEEQPKDKSKPELVVPKVDPLEEAEKEWQQERRTERGKMLYDRIQTNWKTYLAASALNKKITVTQKCQLEIIHYLLRNNASIKHQEAIIAFCERNGRDRETAMAAIDQLLIQRAIIIAMEGSLDYYRINLGWNIQRDIEKAKRVLIMQDKEEEQKKVTQVQKPKPVLSQTVIEKHEKEEIDKSVSLYRGQLKAQLLECLKKEKEPVTIVELLANHEDLGAVNRLSIEEIMKELVHSGKVARIDDGFPPTYKLVD